jgi:hypothetical protein
MSESVSTTVLLLIYCCGRKGDFEACSPTLRRDGADPPTVVPDQLIGNRKPEAGAIASGSKEGIKDPFQIIRAYPWPGILYRNDRFQALSLSPYHHASPFRLSLEGIDENVEQDLFDLLGINQNPIVADFGLYDHIYRLPLCLVGAKS